MSIKRHPIRDPRTVARDIPGVLDVLFPRLTGALVTSLNRSAQSFPELSPIEETDIEQSSLQKSMLFELSVSYVEAILQGNHSPIWTECLEESARKQRLHYDAKIPVTLEPSDLRVAEHAAFNLLHMLNWIKSSDQHSVLEIEPKIPGMGWISSGRADFCFGKTLIEVKHTDRNFLSRDFRQVLMYWLLKYAQSIESGDQIWTDLLLLNPRRNSAIILKFDYLLSSASANSNRVELSELLRSIANSNIDFF
tara:strand:+ start:3951 stop:4703 length:753 start_codon:yes stop_codon:yes gene_type:complete